MIYCRAAKLRYVNSLIIPIGVVAFAKAAGTPRCPNYRHFGLLVWECGAL